MSYAHFYTPGGKANIAGGAGSLLANQPFGDSIAVAGDSFGLSGFTKPLGTLTFMPGVAILALMRQMLGLAAFRMVVTVQIPRLSTMMRMPMSFTARSA